MTENKKFDFLKGMHSDQIELFEKLLEGTGDLKNNFDLFYDMQMRLRKTILALLIPKTSSHYRKVKIKAKDKDKDGPDKSDGLEI